MALKGIRAVQLLVRLGSNSVGRSIVLFLVHRQLVLIGLVFIITFAFSRNSNHLATFVQIPDQVAIEFFSVTSQALAALLGLLIVFLTFRIQTINQQRSSSYRELQAQISKLICLSVERPDELEVLDDNLVQIIDSFTSLRMKHFPTWASQYDVPSFDKMVAGFISKSLKLKDQISRSARLHLQQILLVLDNIAEITETFSDLYVGMLLMSHTVIAIAKLSFLLGASLVSLLLFGVVDLQQIFPDLGLPMIVALVTWLLIVLLELVVDTWRLYNDLRQPWNHSIDQ
jgi:ABC-type multidrug transport system fused ATPase/permease subunit